MFLPNQPTSTDDLIAVLTADGSVQVYSLSNLKSLNGASAVAHQTFTEVYKLRTTQLIPDYVRNAAIAYVPPTASTAAYIAVVRTDMPDMYDSNRMYTETCHVWSVGTMMGSSAGRAGGATPASIDQFLHQTEKACALKSIDKIKHKTEELLGYAMAHDSPHAIAVLHGM